MLLLKKLDTYIILVYISSNMTFRSVLPMIESNNGYKFLDMIAPGKTMFI